MIQDMPRPRLPHLHRERSRHGLPTWYVRIGHGPRIRIRAEYGTPAFEEAYRAAIAGELTPKAGKFPSQTLGWLIARYRDSTAWTELSLATRRQRENIFKHVLKSAGTEPLAKITRKVIVAGRDRRKSTPNAARHFVQTMRGLFKWAAEAEHVTTDPTVNVTVPRPSTTGHHTWTSEECAAFEKRWPRGTRERVAYDVLLYTGLRRGDAVKLGRPHVKNGIATIRTEKTDELVTIRFPALLKKSLAQGPIGELTYIAGDSGRPMTKESFGNWFRGICAKAGVPGSAHGLRKTRATIAAERGVTVAELDAMFGWRGGRMASLYTRAADRARLALEGSKKFDGERSGNFYSRTSASGAGAKRKKTVTSKR